MKKLTFTLIAIVLISCNKKETVTNERETIATDTLAERPPFTEKSLLIIPGTSIGTTVLGNDASTLSALGQPDLSDAAMGKTWMLWYSRKQGDSGSEFMVATGYKDSGMKEKSVKEIRTTSQDFKTAGGNGVGLSILDIVEEFPNIKAVSAYTNIKTGQNIEIFDDEFSGIAFEIQNGSPKKCIAVIIHEKDKPVKFDYAVLHSEFKLKNVDNF